MDARELRQHLTTPDADGGHGAPATALVGWVETALRRAHRRKHTGGPTGLGTAGHTHNRDDLDQED